MFCISKGMQWFLSFFLTMQVATKEGAIIMVDEPGLDLHAMAQEDVLRFLEKVSQKQQVLMTTHSPYLIDANRLDRIRLVLRDEKNLTVINGKSHKGSDKDTMTPIITSIGLDLSKSLVDGRRVNVLVEGITDHYYLEAMKHYLRNLIEAEDVSFIPNVGASQLPNMAAIFIGWGLDFKVLLDNDTAGINTAKVLMDRLGVGKEQIIFVSSEKGAIEDLFSHYDFDHFVLPEDWNSREERNSDKVKGLSKVDLARAFVQKIHSDQEGRGDTVQHCERS